jgi:DNA-binding GntR family transcriptional regulator
MEGAHVIESASVLPEAIYDELRTGIIDQSYAPGTTVTESAVALRFGVARPTAKMAIERLVTEGLLRRELHHAARVPQLGADDIIDLFDNRAVVESAAVAALAAAGSVPVDAMAAHRALLASADRFAEQDIAFHRALVAGQPSPRLVRMHALLMGEIELCIGQVQVSHLLTSEEVAVQHQGILDAISAGDVVVASRLTAEHIAGSRDRLLSNVNRRSANG